jgi:hypothetical protein
VASTQSEQAFHHNYSLLPFDLNFSPAALSLPPPAAFTWQYPQALPVCWANCGVALAGLEIVTDNAPATKSATDPQMIMARVNFTFASFMPVSSLFPLACLPAPSAGATRPTIKQLLLSAEQPKSSTPDKVFKYLNYGRSLIAEKATSLASIKNVTKCQKLNSTLIAPKTQGAS